MTGFRAQRVSPGRYFYSCFGQSFLYVDCFLDVPHPSFKVSRKKISLATYSSRNPEIWTNVGHVSLTEPVPVAKENGCAKERGPSK